MTEWMYCAISNVHNAMKPTHAETLEMARKYGADVDSIDENLIRSLDETESTAELWIFTKSGLQISTKMTGLQQVSVVIAKLGLSGWEMIGVSNNVMFFKKAMEK